MSGSHYPCHFQCTASVSQKSSCVGLCQGASASQHLPNDAAQVVIIYWRGPFLKDVTSLRAVAVCVTPTIATGYFHPPTWLCKELNNQLAWAGRHHVHRHKDECVPCVNLSLSPFTQMVRDITWLVCWVQSLLPSSLRDFSQLGFNDGVTTSLMQTCVHTHALWIWAPFDTQAKHCRNLSPMGTRSHKPPWYLIPQKKNTVAWVILQRQGDYIW